MLSTHEAALKQPTNATLLESLRSPALTLNSSLSTVDLVVPHDPKQLERGVCVITFNPVYSGVKSCRYIERLDRHK